MEFSLRRLLAQVRCLNWVLVLALVPPLTSVALAADRAAPLTIIVVRHGEKEGTTGDVPLSAAGRVRAESLARTLESAGVQHIFTSEMKRTQEMAEPLAKRLGLTITPLPAKPSDALTAALTKLPAGAVALVVQHGNTIFPLFEKFGVGRPGELAEHEFDRMFVLTRDAQGACSVVELRYGPSNPPPSAAPKH